MRQEKASKNIPHKQKGLKLEYRLLKLAYILD